MIAQKKHKETWATIDSVIVYRNYVLFNILSHSAKSTIDMQRIPPIASHRELPEGIEPIKHQYGYNSWVMDAVKDSAEKEWWMGECGVYLATGEEVLGYPFWSEVHNGLTFSDICSDFLTKIELLMEEHHVGKNELRLIWGFDC